MLRPALDIPYCHHEKWDGTGYPRGRKGEQIPLSARILAVVDVYDALSSDRPYRPNWPQDKVLAHIQELSGSHFDPRVVDAFLELSEQGKKEIGIANCEFRICWTPTKFAIRNSNFQIPIPQ
jgi:HD-GYP domain-containing protein (c-di-GMP phosphodiesterase class II)